MDSPKTFLTNQGHYYPMFSKYSDAFIFESTNIVTLTNQFRHIISFPKLFNDTSEYLDCLKKTLPSCQNRKTKAEIDAVKVSV